DMRQMTVDQAWTQRWVSPDSLGAVELNVIEYTSWQFNTTTLGCQPRKSWDFPGANQVGLMFTGDLGAGGCVIIDRGRILFVAHVSTYGPGAESRVEATLKAITAAASPQIIDSPDQWEGGRWTAARTQTLMLWMNGLIFVGLVATLPGLVFDKMAWVRLHPRNWKRRRRPPGDVEPAARAIRAQLRALALTRFAALIWTLRLTEEIHWGAYKTMAALVVVYLLGIVVGRLVKLRRTGRARTVQHQTAKSVAFLLLGLGLSLVVALGAVLLFQFALSFGALGPMLQDVTAWQASRIQTVLQLVSIWVLGFAMVPLSFFRRRARRALRDRRPKGVPPVLILRTFADDHLDVRVRDADRAGLLDHFLMKRRETLEQIVAFSLAPQGPPLALGEPKKPLPPGLGAIRLYFDEEQWSSGVDRLCEEAALIAVTLGRSKSLEVELGKLQALGVLSKTIFVVPPVPISEQQARLALLSDKLGVPWSYLNTAGKDRRTVAVCFPGGEAIPVVVTAASQDDISYQLGIARCVQALDQAWSLSEANSMVPQPTVAASNAGRPPVVVVPKGASKRFRGAWRLGVAWSLMLLLAVIGEMAKAPPGTALPEPGHGTKELAMPADSRFDRIVGAEGDNYWFIQDDNLLVRWDTKADKAQPIGFLSGGVAYAVTLEGNSVLVGMSDGDAGHVALASFDLATAEEQWRVEVEELAPSMVANDGQLWVPVPSQQSVEIRSTADGSLIRSTELGCQPWAVGTLGESVWVTCPRDMKIVRLDLDGAITETEVTPSGVTEVLEWSGDEWWVMPADMRIVRSNGQDVIRLSWAFSGLQRQADARGDLLAVVGFERISVFKGELGNVKRLNTQMPTRTVMVTSSGNVAYASDIMLVVFPP
ncbi:MAG: hypothetical protein FWG16_03535, partial [Micrococcales bacterium]|nr:hypothetical protein [Micrococcales bacterium]